MVVVVVAAVSILYIHLRTHNTAAAWMLDLSNITDRNRSIDRSIELAYMWYTDSVLVVVAGAS